MKFSLIICTYMRAVPLEKLLLSVQKQTLYPDEILVIDGSSNDATQKMTEMHRFKNVFYFLAAEHLRGLTKQRNYGITKAGKSSEIIAFLDDDTELMPDYFEELIKTFTENPDVVGVGGIAINENNWSPAIQH